MKEKIGAIDVMNYVLQCVPEAGEAIYTYEDFKWADRQYGLKWPWPGTHGSVGEMIAEMDTAGYDKIVMSAPYLWLSNKSLGHLGTIEQVREVVQEANGRVIGAASYNPFNIEKSLKEIEVAVKDWGFKMVYFHGETFDMALNDRRFYPCYAKCCELGIPVSMQVGHSAELFPSWGGRPIYLDSVALDFPSLKIILSHTGWPWVDEFTAMVRKHTNVYGDISSWPPKTIPSQMPNLLQFMSTQFGQRKLLFGTNNMGLTRCLEQFLALPLTNEAKKAILRDNAVKLLGLDQDSR